MKNTKNTISVEIPMSADAVTARIREANRKAAIRAAIREYEEDRMFATGAEWKKFQARESMFGRRADMRVSDYV